MTFAALLRRSHRLSALSLSWALLALGFVSLVAIQRQIDSERGIFAPIADVLYVPSGKNLLRFSLGNEGLLADVYWTRAVQYYGRGQLQIAHKRYDLLAPLLQIATDLDPRLLIAYRFGAIFLMEGAPVGAGQPQAAIQLLRRGIVANPDYWRLWQDLGFVYYWQLKDYTTAAKIFATGGDRPGAGFWLKALAGTVAAKGGDLETSRILWSEIDRTAATDSIRQTAQAHLAAILSIQEMNRLNGLLDTYREKQGRNATSILDLVRAGMLRGLPLDPSGVPFVLGTGGEATLGPGSPVNLKLLSF